MRTYELHIDYNDPYYGESWEEYDQPKERIDQLIAEGYEVYAFNDDNELVCINGRWLTPEELQEQRDKEEANRKARQEADAIREAEERKRLASFGDEEDERIEEKIFDAVGDLAINKTGKIIRALQNAGFGACHQGGNKIIIYADDRQWMIDQIELWIGRTY